MAEVNGVDAAESWAEVYRSVLRLGAALEQGPESGGDTRFYAEFCDSLRAYLIDRCGVDAERLARMDIEAAVEHENWDAVWSASPAVLRLDTH